jgi:uncharacterized membrane protein YgdD (TMEM256/DUF423 family)
MRQTWKAWVVLAAVNGLIAVAAGAYAAHGLKIMRPYRGARANPRAR